MYLQQWICRNHLRSPFCSPAATVGFQRWKRRGVRSGIQCFQTSFVVLHTQILKIADFNAFFNQKVLLLLANVCLYYYINAVNNFSTKKFNFKSNFFRDVICS